MEIEQSLAEIIKMLTSNVVGMRSQPLGARFSDLSLRQIYYLEMIAELENPTPTDLAKKMELSKPSVSAAVDKLVRDGYIRKVPSAEDQRSYHIHLTQKGRQVAQEHETVHHRIAQHLIANLDQAEVEQLARLMDKIVRSIQE